ncbi:flagellar motor switch protein FliN [Leptospira ilyithenensis]|uniref:Flagellar motor switch protein FliN n=1 Tax=Leptospira ilyithenensis TaxID=2484901 RepID=A0A4R9LMD2_9LEPT|nr:flagellar motor switch protein FliN [Leptospira ilyithenensis]TGN07168.1 flagellar motor switch protein FliN [Leptospira ilyithenensis]
MGEGSLSQDEIDALLQGADDTFDLSSLGGAASSDSDTLSPIDRDIISDVVGSAFQVAGNTLGTILAKNTRFMNPATESSLATEVQKELGTKTVCLYSNLSGSLTGRVSLIMAQENAAKVAGVMMGGMTPPGQLDNAQLQTLKDSMSPIIGTITAQIGMKLNGAMSGTPADIAVVNAARDLQLPDDSNLVKTTLSLNIEGVGSFKVYYVISLSMAHSILDIQKGGATKASSGGGGGMNVAVPGGGMGMGMAQSSVGIKGVNFPSLATAGAGPGQTNLNLLMDVQMALTVELGRTKMYIKDILGLGEGSIIELDKLAGEPVDLLVNGKLIAKGEVVVIDENFGVRVTDIVSPTDRLKGEK